MAVKTENELSENAKSLWLKALSAMELRNYGYTISLLQAVLKETPEFLNGRKVLRKAEIQGTKGKRGGMLSGLSASSLRSGNLVKKDPLAALESAEKMLESDPYGAAGNNLLKEAAKALGFTEIVSLALETLAEGNPKDTKILHELGQHYYDCGEADKAVAVYNKIVEVNPADLVALKKGKDAAARATIKSGKWDTATSYRDVMKDKTEAESLEQQNRVVLSGDMVERQLTELSQRYEKEPENVDVVRKIAGLYEQKEDFDSAIQWYQWANELTKGADPTFARKVADLQLRVVDLQIESRVKFVTEAPDHPDTPQYKDELETLRKQRASMQVTEARKRVERNPTDPIFRFELGEQLIALGQFTEAIPELQKARNNPNVRLRAMSLLGSCYTGKGMLDFAQRIYEDAVKEMLVMDATKKEMLYNLGMVYEKMGKPDKCLECMKQIYDIDYGYKDVAHRVESSYGDPAAAAATG